MRIPSGVTDQYIYFVGVDSTDLKTRETGLSSFTVYRSRDGGAAAAMTTPTINETDSTNMPGVYELLLDEDMTITAGNDSEEMVFHITHAGMAPVTRTIELYRSKITAGYTLGVESDGDLTKVNTLDGHTAQTGDNYARIGAPAGASVSADIAAIEAQTDDIGVAGAGLTAVPWNAAWDAEVQSEVTDALNAYDPATHAELISEINDVQTDIGNLNDPTAAAIRAEIDSNSTQLAAIVSDTNELQTDDVPGLIAGLNDPTAAAVADAVWEEAIADHSGTSGSTAEALNAAGSAGDPWTTALPGAYGAGSAGNIIGNLNDLSAAEVNSEVDTALADYDPPTHAELISEINDVQTDISNLNDPTAAAIRAEIDSNSTQLAAIVSDTNELQTDDVPGLIAGLNDPTAAAIRAEIDSNSTQLAAIVADTNELQTDDVPGLIAGLNDLSATDLENIIIETGYTLKQTLQLIAAATAGKLSGAATTTNTIRNLADDTNRITATVDSDGNRTAVAHNV